MTFELPSPEERRQAALEDGSGVSSYVARERAGLPTDDEEETMSTPARKVGPTRRQINRRGGRSYNEGSDSEHDPYWTAESPDLTAEQKLAALAGLEKVRDALRASMKQPEQPSEEEILAERRADAARIREQARQSWAEFDEKE